MDTPFLSPARAVDPSWIDINQHMNATHYGLVIYDAHAAFTTALGLGDDYVQTRRCGKVVLESHMIYEREVALGDTLQVRSWLLAVDAKRLHFFHELLNTSRGVRSACAEQIDIHVDLVSRKSAALPDDVAARLQAVVRQTRQLPLPPSIGSQLRAPANHWLDA